MSTNAETDIREVSRKLAARAAECRALAAAGKWADVERVAREIRGLEARLEGTKARPLRTNITGRVRVDG